MTRTKLPEGGDGGEIAGGDHDAERGNRERELEQAKGEAPRRPRHALDVLHPHPGWVLGRIRKRRRLHRVYRRPANEHLPYTNSQIMSS